MKMFLSKNVLILFFVNIFCISSFAQGKINIEEYKLDNGLTIILNQDDNKSEVFGYMVCKAGGKDDPSDATGMAHYMEHMLFKGTTELGTTNWEKEKIHIDSICMLYDKLGYTKDEDERKKIQKEINKQAVTANKYAIPNEFDKVVKKLGGTELNANTSPDRTVYFNTFPPNQIEPWLELYAHRIQDAVFRGFQSELEVVYEEKNMYSEMFQSNILEAFQKYFFKNHPYGQQLLIGTVEDLKNPSLTKMKEFYKTWYVPNNMALVLCGDFDKEKVKSQIKNAFDSWQRKETPKRKTWKEEPFKAREYVEVKMSPVKVGILGFRTVPDGHPDNLALTVCNGILSNESGSGILDELTLNNEVLVAEIITNNYYDYGMSLILVVPKIIGQKLEDAEKLALDKIQLIKKGEFEYWRVEASKKEIYRQHHESMETNEYRGIQIGEMFARGGDIKSINTYPNRINNITKKDVIDIANKYYGENYLAFYSKMGSSKGEKIKKPGFEPVVSNKSEKSSFAKKIENIKPTASNTKYIDFNKDVAHRNITKGVDLYLVNNPLNDIYNLQIKFKVGNYDLPMLKYTTQIMDMAYTEKYGKKELKNEIAKLGASYYIYSDNNYTTIYISGIEKDFINTLKIINDLVNNPIVDKEEIAKIVENEKANRKIERNEPESVANAAYEWVKFQDKSDYLNRLTIKEIKALLPADLIKIFSQATKYQVELHYTGKKEATEVSKIIKENLTFNKNLKANNIPIYKPINQYSDNTVFFINKKSAVQSKIFFLSNGKKIGIPEIPSVKAFNQYFSGGFSGLVLQEIREYRSLAYGAGAGYKIEFRNENPGYFTGYIGTQADKTNDALDVFMDLVKNMPKKEDRMEYIKPYLVQSSLSQTPDFRGLSEYVLYEKKKGYKVDPAEFFAEQYTELEFKDIMNFYQQTIKGKPMVITVVGNKKKLNYKELSKYGNVINIDEKSLFRD